MNTEETIYHKERVPLLGDLPVMGRLFRSESSEKSTKRLLLFVTPRIIGPDGHPLTSEKEISSPDRK